MSRAVRKPLLLFGLILCLCFSSAISQTVEFRDVPGRDGVQVGYNRFEDRSTLTTKRSVVSGVTGKGSLLNPNVNMRSVEILLAVSWKGQEIAERITEVLFVIFPEPTTRGGSFVSRLEGPRLYIAPESKVIALADSERFDFGEVLKPATLTALGSYSGAAGVVVPIASLRKLLAAKKLELAVGVIEVRFSKQSLERMRSLLAEIDARSSRR